MKIPIPILFVNLNHELEFINRNPCRIRGGRLIVKRGKHGEFVDMKTIPPVIAPSPSIGYTEKPKSYNTLFPEEGTLTGGKDYSSLLRKSKQFSISVSNLKCVCASSKRNAEL